MTKVAVALSGGLDSSVTAYLLKKQGYEVIGITGLMTQSEAAINVVNNAKKVAEYLDIEHYTIDTTKDFQDKVINYFDSSYKNGETPNPCIMCNKFIKWGKLFDVAINELNADYIATGHYANIKKVDNYYKLYPAKDTKKDQLYFLFQLNQEQLSKTLFPLYSYEKTQIRQIAIENNLPSKSSKESQDICFIQKPMTTKKYLLDRIAPQKGNFVDISTGKILGQHDGYFQYTIGQRKGIGIAAPEPLYVVRIDSKKNIVYVGNKDATYQNKLELENLNYSYHINKNEFDALVKIRYNMQPVKTHIINNKDKVIIQFNEPINSIAEGQACVLYDINDGHLIGGAFI